MPMWPFLFFCIWEEGVKLILSISGSLCACSSTIDPSLQYSWDMLWLSQWQEHKWRCLKEALSPKVRQGFPAQRKIKGEYNFYLLPLFWSSLYWRDSRNTLDVLFFKTGRAGRLWSVLSSPQVEDLQELLGVSGMNIDLMKMVFLSARCHIILPYLPSIISSSHLLSALCFHSCYV